MIRNNVFLEDSKDVFEIAAHPCGKLNYPAHFHSALELIYCRDGGVTLYLDRYARPLRKGMLALVPQMTAHGFAGEEDVDCRFVFIPESALLRIKEAPIFTAHPEGYVCSAAEGDPLRKDTLFSALYACIEKEDTQLASGYASILLTVCLREMEADHRTHELPDEDTYRLLRKILLYVQERHRQEISIDSLCKEFSASRSTISRLLNTYAHTTLPELVNRYRMLEAEYLLHQTDLPITQIAEQIGYNSICCFNRNFQKQFGVSPRTHRAERTEDTFRF